MIRARHAMDAHARGFLVNDELLPILKKFSQCTRSHHPIGFQSVAPTNSLQSPAPPQTPRTVRDNQRVACGL